jgi:hypothetical protein
MISWKKIHPEILAAIEGLKEHGFTEPTVRSVYYVLGSQNVIPLTDYGYQKLVGETVAMRKSGEIAWGFFAVKRGTSDEVGVSVGLPHDLRATVPFVGAKSWSDFWLGSLRAAPEAFELPRWYRQPNLVEVWVEKDGLLGATSTWLEDLGVTVRSPQGYGAWEFSYASLRKMKEELEEQHKTSIQILYLGDLDPSGKDIPRALEEGAFSYFGEKLGITVEFRELGLSPAQVEKFNLPPMPKKKEVLGKLHRDSRYAWFVERYGSEMFVELDAFYALATDEAKALIRGEVEALFDEKVYERTRQEQTKLRREIRERIEGGR